MVIITVCSWTGKPGSFRIKNGSYNNQLPVLPELRSDFLKDSMKNGCTESEVTMD